MTHMMNPESGRMIKIGGASWRRLVREGMIDNIMTKEDNVLYEANSVEDAELAKKEILSEQYKIMAAKRLIDEQRPARIGKKVIKKLKPRKHEDLAKYTAQCASRTLHKHMHEISDKLDEAYANSSELDATQLSEFEENLKGLILQEMISGGANKKPTIKTRKKKANVETDYEVESLMSESQYEDSQIDTEQEHTETEYEDDLPTDTDRGETESEYEEV